MANRLSSNPMMMQVVTSHFWRGSHSFAKGIFAAVAKKNLALKCIVT